MPWQRQLLQIAGELTDDGHAMRHPYVVVHVPRRAGKSASVLTALLQRCAVGPGRRCWYTAQTRADAALTYRDDWSPMIRSSPLYPRGVKLRQSNGSEALTWRPTLSTAALFAPTATALHGQDADMAVVDEGWSFTLEAGGAVEAGIQPAQLTRSHRQLWIVSAGGTDQSSWLARWLQLGRDGTPGVALIDYGADPDHDDLDDPAVWARVHPAVGHTISLEALESMRGTMDQDEFHRAVLGVWTTGNATPARLPRELWDAGHDPDRDDQTAPTGPTLGYGLAVAHDGAAAAIAAASIAGDGRVLVELLEHAPGTDWIPGRWRAIRARNRGRLLVDQLGPASGTVDTLARLRLPLEVMTTSGYVTACEQILNELRSGQLRHRAQPALDASAATATARAVGDRWVWDRRTGDTSPIEAVTLAVAAARRPAPVLSVHVAAG